MIRYRGTTTSDSIRRPRRFSAAVVLSIVTVLLAACGGGGDDGTTSSAGVQAEGESPNGRRLQIGVTSDLPSWDPFLRGADSYPMTRNVYEPLVDYDESYDVVPVLAEDYEVSSSGDVATVQLRQDVEFHNGKPLTVEAVQAAYELARDPETGGALPPILASLSGVEVVDDATLTFTFSQPLPEQAITDILQVVPIPDPESMGDLQTTGVGTGPYRQGERVPGRQYSLEVFDEYWGPMPGVAGLDYRVFTDSQSLVSALQSGAVDVLFDGPYSAIPQLQDGFEVVDNPIAAGLFQLQLNAATETFSDERVRRAFYHGVDRETITETVLAGVATAQPLHWPMASPAYDEALAETLTFDLDRAEQLLSEAGASGTQAELLVPNIGADFEAAAQIIQADMATVGVTLDIVVLDIAEFLERILSPNFEIAISTIGFTNKYPASIASAPAFRVEENTSFLPEGTPPGYYAAAVEKAMSATAPEAQEKAFRELNAAIARMAVGVPIAARPLLMIHSDEVEGVHQDIDARPLFGAAAVR